MTAPEPDGETIASAFRHAVVRVDEAWSRFLASPDAQSIHQLRISIRRAEAAARILPRRLRDRGNTRRFLGVCEAIFDALGAARDLEVMADRLQEQKDPAFAQTVQALRREAAQRAEDAYELALTARPARIPWLSPEKLDNHKLRRRFRKTVRRLAKETVHGLAKTLAEEHRSEIAHQTRRSAKKLRYTLELVGARALEPLLRHLAVLQDRIGAVHDLDVAIVRLKVEPRTPLGRALRNSRRTHYQSLVRFCKDFGDPIATFVGAL